MSFIGRDQERATLRAAFSDVAGGQGPRLALVRGEPGVGKTELVNELAHFTRDGASVLYGGCTEIALAPYQAFAEALTRPRLIEQVARSGAGEADRYVFFNAVTQLLVESCADRPVVLVLEDLHWADTHSVELLQYLIRSEGLARVLLVGTYRDTDVEQSGPLARGLAELEAEPDVVVIRLEGWTEADVRTYVAEVVSDSPVAANVAHELLAETGGNPFFVSELLRHLLDVGVVDLEAAGLPESVREVVLARVTRNGPDTARLLSAAAVAGTQCDAELLAEVAEMPVDEASALLERATQLVLLRKDGPDAYCFAHALVQHALYDELSAVRRSRIHHRVAAVLERRWGSNAGAHAGELAHHLIEAHEPGGRPRAAAYARDAAEWASQSFAPGEAARWYAIALELAVDGFERLSYLVGLGDAQRQAGDPQFRTTLLRAAWLAKDMGDEDALVAAALANNRGFASSTGGIDAERVAVLEAALDVTALDSAARARLEALLAMELCWDPDGGSRRLALVDDAIAIARRSNDRALLAEVLHRRIMAVWGPSTLVERARATAELEALARDAGDPVREFWACFYGTTTACEAADPAEAERRLARAVELAGLTGQPLLQWTISVSRCWWTLICGDIAEAEFLADEVLRLGGSLGQTDAFPIYGTLLFGVRWHQGRLAELTRLIHSGLRTNPELTVFQASYALACLDSGEDDEARAALRAAVEAGFASPDLVWLTTMTSWAEVAARLDERDAADGLYAMLLPWAGQIIFSGAGIHGAVAHYLGMLAGTLGRPDDAAAHFAQAAELHEHMGMPFFIARTRAAQGA